MHFKMSSAICFNLDQSKILSPGNRLTVKKVENFGTRQNCCKECTDTVRHLPYSNTFPSVFVRHNLTVLRQLNNFENILFNPLLHRYSL